MISQLLPKKFGPLLRVVGIAVVTAVLLLVLFLIGVGTVVSWFLPD